MPTIGGQPTRLAQGGRNPHFSPDGQWIAYWMGIHGGSILTGGEGGEIYVVPASSGEARRLAVDLPLTGDPIWSRGGKRLLVLCLDTSDWCVISMNGEPSRRTGIFDSLKRQAFQSESIESLVSRSGRPVRSSFRRFMATL
jgi:hypothetical protein